MDEESNFPTILCLIILLIVIIVLVYFKKSLYERFTNRDESSYRR